MYIEAFVGFDSKWNKQITFKFTSDKVGVPKLNTTMVRCQFKHSHQKVIICSKESCLCVQNMLKHSKLNSQYDLRDNMYDH